jgi:hypothetical protein
MMPRSWFVRRRPVLLLALLFPLLAACDVVVSPPAVVGTIRISLPGDPVVVYRQPRLLAYPGAQVTRVDLRDERSRVEFRSSASLLAVYRDVELQLLASGWSRSSYRERGDRIDATFVQGSARLTVDLRDRGRDGYRLDLRAR